MGYRGGIGREGKVGGGEGVDLIKTHICMYEILSKKKNPGSFSIAF